jgi:preprotein translocase subunit SecD
MYQYPTWKYWLVGIVLVLGILLSLPNVFGEAPALQLARNDRQPMDDSHVEGVLDVLESKKIPVDLQYLEEGRLVLRFANAEQQTRARKVLEESVANEFSMALASVPRTPGIMRRLGFKPMSLGLDLRGGVYFLYEVDVKGAITQALERIERDIRSQLRDERIPYVSVVNQNGRIRVTLRDAAQLAAAEKIIKGEDATLTVTTETSPAPAIVVAMTPEQIKTRQNFAIQQNVTTLRNRVNELGVSEPIVTQQGAERIVVQLPGVQDPNQAMRVLGATATLEFRLVDESNDAYEAQQTKRVPIGSRLYAQRDGRPILLKRELIVSGDQLTDATTAFGDQGPEVSVRLDDRGGKQMLAATRENVGRRMAVVYKERKRVAEGEVCNGTRDAQWCTKEEVVTAPTIQSVLSSSFRITGFNAAEAHDLALTLRAGSLATSIDVVEQRTVGPSLGKDNIEAGTLAMIVGMAATFVFMALYYRGFGLIACVVLTANVVLLIGVMSLMHSFAALSLPGIAGIVLTVGMAADANVLIYERIREELRNGNTPQAAIHAGFDKAFSAIADSNITTLIAGIVLFAVGTGPIKGFAATLVIGIATSLFTAILGSRALIQLIWGGRRKLASLPV